MMRFSSMRRSTVCNLYRNKVVVSPSAFRACSFSSLSVVRTRDMMQHEDVVQRLNIVEIPWRSTKFLLTIWKMRASDIASC